MQRHIFHYFSVIIEWVLDPIVTATAIEKMGIIAMDGGVHIVMATENKKNIEFICRCFRSMNEL